jgi:hypothetical protein
MSVEQLPQDPTAPSLPVEAEQAHALMNLNNTLRGPMSTESSIKDYDPQKFISDSARISRQSYDEERSHSIDASVRAGSAVEYTSSVNNNGSVSAKKVRIDGYGGSEEHMFSEKYAPRAAALVTRLAVKRVAPRIVDAANKRVVKLQSDLDRLEK